MIKYLPYGENLVKIGLADPEIICLKGFIFKTILKCGKIFGKYAERAK